MSKIVMDIWSGPRHMDHVARFIRNLDDSLPLIKEALDRGDLVNLRLEAEWGNFADFDSRKARTQ